jgi:signal transduction histidine kinase
MVGNLLDNACKWAKSKVCVSASRADGAGNFEVLVDDDGPGLTEAERVKVVERGQRLDETKPGSGLGLSIVADLAHLYRGRFELEPSPQGGLRARLQLPAA